MLTFWLLNSPTVSKPVTPVSTPACVTSWRKFRMSVPAPPMVVALNRVAEETTSTRSSPSPASMKSLPTVVMMSSSPAPPRMESAALPPTIVSLPPPPMMVVDALAWPRKSSPALVLEPVMEVTPTAAAVCRNTPPPVMVEASTDRPVMAPISKVLEPVSTRRVVPETPLTALRLCVVAVLLVPFRTTVSVPAMARIWLLKTLTLPASLLMLMRSSVRVPVLATDSCWVLAACRLMVRVPDSSVTARAAPVSPLRLTVSIPAWMLATFRSPLSAVVTVRFSKPVMVATAGATGAPMATRSAAVATRVSMPAPPSTVSEVPAARLAVRLAMRTVSLPSPPETLTTPDPACTRSLPAPANTESLPVAALMASSPVPPTRKSSLLMPVRVSLPAPALM
eukprot:Opistho-1_new@82917